MLIRVKQVGSQSHIYVIYTIDLIKIKHCRDVTSYKRIACISVLFTSLFHSGGGNWHTVKFGGKSQGFVFSQTTKPSSFIDTLYCTILTW